MNFLVMVAGLLTLNLAGAETPHKRLVIVGDSLTEGYGVSRPAAYPALLEKKIKSAGKKWHVINSGVSGSTSASAVNRVKWHLKQKPDLLIIALGANDGLRAQDVKALEKNLTEAIQLAKSKDVPVILAGMKLPPNYGKDYSEKFAAVFPRVAQTQKVPLIPFLLEKVGGHTQLNLSDGIHPNEEGHKIIADTVFKAIKDRLK
ncbi:MAG: arylesterase [Bdellovibrionales bacterium]